MQQTNLYKKNQIIIFMQEDKFNITMYDKQISLMWNKKIIENTDIYAIIIIIIKKIQEEHYEWTFNFNKIKEEY